MDWLQSEHLFFCPVATVLPWQSFSAEHRETWHSIHHRAKPIFFQELLTQAWALLNNPLCFDEYDHIMQTFLTSPMPHDCMPGKGRTNSPCSDCRSLLHSKICVVLAEKSQVPHRWVQRNINIPGLSNPREEQCSIGRRQAQNLAKKAGSDRGTHYSRGFQSVGLFLPVTPHCKWDSLSSSSLMFSSYPS